MGQLGFFDAEKRLSALSKKGDPLEAIAALVPWESFRADIEAVVLTPEEAKKSTAGRTPAVEGQNGGKPSEPRAQHGWHEELANSETAPVLSQIWVA